MNNLYFQEIVLPNIYEQENYSEVCSSEGINSTDDDLSDCSIIGDIYFETITYRRMVRFTSDDLDPDEMNDLLEMENDRVSQVQYQDEMNDIFDYEPEQIDHYEDAINFLKVAGFDENLNYNEYWNLIETIVHQSNSDIDYYDNYTYKKKKKNFYNQHSKINYESLENDNNLYLKNLNFY